MRTGLSLRAIGRGFEPRLTAAELFARWPDRVAEVLGHDEERAWLLLADAGTPIGVFGNSPEAWLVALPLYAELQRGEAAHTHEHLTHHVPDLRVATLPRRYEDLLQHILPLESDEVRRLQRFAARFAELCGELAAHDVPETIQHDDLHMANVYAQGKRLRLLDWATRRSRTPLHRSSSRFGSSRRSTSCRRPTRGSRGCATRTWNRGVAVSLAGSRSRSASARSRTRSHGRGSGTRCRRRHAPSSTGGSQSCCGAQSLRRSNRARAGALPATRPRVGVALPPICESYALRDEQTNYCRPMTDWRERAEAEGVLPRGLGAS